jgi:hypothetical protein
MQRAQAALISIAIGLACSLAAAQFTASTASTPSAPSIQPLSGPWDVAAGFAFATKSGKTRQSLSGIACNLNQAGQRICLVAFDEGVQARWASVTDHGMQADPEPVLLRPDTGELDAEAAATDGRFFYVTGSHSAKRSSCASNPHSRHLVRFRVDPATGRAQRSASGALVDYADTGQLWATMQAQPGLAAYVGEGACLGTEPPGRNGVNIEGMAVRDGRLYFGFRAPVLQGTAGVLAVDADALFNGTPAEKIQAHLTPLRVGAGRGIRDMVAVAHGFLVLAGPDDDKTHDSVGWTVLWWDGQPSTATVTPRILASLDLSHIALRRCDKELKPEAITVLAETAQAYQLLVLSDGMCDGGPMRFNVDK